MFRKLTAVIMAMAMVFSVMAMLTSCSGETEDGIKIGVILIGDETEGYSKAHIDGIKAAAAELGVSESNIIWKYKTLENSDCLDAATDLVGQGCSLIISNSYGHQTYMVQAAEQYPDITFAAMTGDFAALTGRDNFKNGFMGTYESRYVSGVVAGLKLEELLTSGTLTTETQPKSFDENGNVKIGYVGAFDYAEVVSGYTAFYLGVKSIVENVVMDVNYTESWFDIDKEAAAAEALIADGCVIICQHADSTGAPSATEKLLNNGTICYSVGYNIDMIDTAPNAALTSATNNWAVYYKELIGSVINDTDMPVDFSAGYAKDGVKITALGKACAEGTAEKVAAVEAGLKDGSVKVFDTSKFTVSAEQFTCTVTTDDAGHVTSCLVDTSFMDWSTMTPIYQGETVECIKDGAFVESVHRSAPYFSIRIDGINEN